MIETAQKHSTKTQHIRADATVTHQTNLWRQSLLAVLTSLLFAGRFVAGRYTTNEMGPLLITLLRYVIVQKTEITAASQSE